LLKRKVGQLRLEKNESEDASYMPNNDFANVVWKEGKDFVAWNINTSISSFGETQKEALASLREALELYFEDR
jgi:hypothetical protein